MEKCTKGYLAQRTGQLPPVTRFIFLRRSFSSGPIVPTYKWKIIIHVPCYHQLENEVLKVKDFEVMWRSKFLHNGSRKKGQHQATSMSMCSARAYASAHPVAWPEHQMSKNCK